MGQSIYWQVGKIPAIIGLVTAGTHVVARDDPRCKALIARIGSA